ncbi:PREDICTED: G-box-binding factor 1-like isoform X4 [Tarenaya hassleriana]|uniref:G-box-binding factor 1-like isoform X4 n=1 Tax=Tarenaya hassleriana TaxID=28532 RepID=UPI00053C9FC1|nr:PREDICTED: G-box-binding factor 1-like isoform X4 [Tarenaya hassleriana]
MGTGEGSTPSKSSKPSSSTQEVPSVPYPDWSSSVQAYYGVGGTPAAFFPTPVASPSPHPYMWGAQHPMMPPYGTPVPYPALYPPGGIYAHPSMPMAPNSAPANTENVVKDQTSAKKSKENSKGKGEGGEKKGAASGSGNDGVSRSGESETEDSSDGNDENTNQQAKGSSRKGSSEQTMADGTLLMILKPNMVSGICFYFSFFLTRIIIDTVQGIVPVKAVAPSSNLNIGMDLWSPEGASKMRPNTSNAIVPAPPLAARGGVPSEQWIHGFSLVG